jgi:hypothetical protein
MYVWTADREEWVIAASAEDARDVYCAHIGTTPSLTAEDDGSADGGTHASHWEKLPDDEIVKIQEECQAMHRKGQTCPNGCDKDFLLHHKKTASAWAEGGRGYLCSANF